MNLRHAYTVEAIAEETGKSKEYIRGLIRDNKLPAKRLGKTPLVLAADYEVFLELLPEA
ncbi:hypothetical protein [Agromyces sp. NPDC056965]|uniref:hypothetical protein n=1 Tax=Agromyces sp. NPDC056965 TaxID=3345983 RepID=UPI003638FDDD